MPKLHTQPVKCGVIGYGGAFNMGRQHLNEMKAAGMVPTAVAEIDPKRLEVATTDFPGIETYSSVEEMLNKSPVELLAIITPHNTHASLAIQSLKAGKHVVTEKPFAITTQECDDMIAAAKEKDLCVSTYHNRHWDGWILRAVDQIVTKRVIGDVYKINARFGSRGRPGDWWRSFKSISGGVMYDWGVHLLEYSLQLLPGQTVTEVTGLSHTGYWASMVGAETPWKNDAIEDEGRLIARMSGGAWIEVQISTLDSIYNPNFVEVVGTEGSYQVGWNNWTLTNWDGTEKVVREGKHPPSEGSKLYQNVADHLTKGTTLVISPEWARRPIHILDLAAQSAKAGKTLAAKYG
jgi:predicted dehydrogenase